MASQRAGERLAILRADASAAIGGGHIARCVSIVHALRGRGWECVLATSPEATEIIPGLREAVRVVEIDARSLGDPAAVGLAVARRADLAVIDHYGLDAAFETGCREWARRVLALDDLPNRVHDCDILVDQTPGRGAEDYAGLVPAQAAVLAGHSYTLVAPAFSLARSQALARRQRREAARHLVIAMGATDPGNLTARVLREMLTVNWPGRISVLLSSRAPHMEDIRALVRGQADIRLLPGVGAAEIAAVLAEADLAIGAAGVSTWERCCLGLPALLLVAADNQRGTAEAVANAGAGVLLGRPDDLPGGAIGAAAMAVAADAGRLVRLAENAAAMCDGGGASRVAEAVEWGL